MTPAARIAAAIDLLDVIVAGEPAEKTLTHWARKNRYAGSKDRAAIRDHVFDALRRKLSFAALGGAMTGRGLMIGALRDAGTDPAELFTGEGYGPAVLTPDELAFEPADMDELTALDFPDWLAEDLRQALGKDFAAIVQKMRHRAPVFVRVNLQKTTLEAARKLLLSEEIEAISHTQSPTALEITKNPRRLRNSEAYKTGLVELQDVGSQAVTDSIPLKDGARILDYCAGGGGKSLALAGRGAKNIVAFDVNTRRLADLPTRADRAGVNIPIFDQDMLDKATPFDLVIADVPCSGSGAWRRSPEGKWRLTPESLDELCAVQAGILNEISKLAAPDGMIAYVTCSLLERENQAQITDFIARNPEWKLRDQMTFSPLENGDGFYLALLER